MAKLPKPKPARAVPAQSPVSTSLQIDRDTLRDLLRTLERGGVTEFEYEDERIRLRIGRGAPAATYAPLAPQAFSGASLPPPAAEPREEAANMTFVTSPFVGTFYRAASPDAPVFADVGSVIKPGQTLCIVEAMKLMNEIESDIAGTVVEVLVENGKSIEFGQKLFKVRP